MPQQPTKALALFLGVLFLVAFIISMAAWRHAPYSTYDTASYLTVARDLQDGSLNILHDRTVGYPILLLFTQSVERPSRLLFIVQLLLHFAAVAMLVLALLRHGISRKIALGFAVMGVSPPFLVYTAYALTESVLTFCIVLMICGLWSWLFEGSKSGLIGAIMGNAACGLIRPSLLGVGIACAIVLAVWHKRDKHASIPQVRIQAGQWCLIVVPLLLCLIMVGFNRQRFHYTGLTPMMWKYLSTKTVRLTERIPASEPVKEYLVTTRDRALLKPRSFHDGQAYMHDLDPAMLRQLTGITDDGELARYLTRLQVGLIVRSPLVYLLEVGGAMVTYWFPAKFAPHSSSGFFFWLWVIVDFGIIGLFFALSGLLLSALLLLRWWRLSLGNDMQMRQSILCSLLALSIVWYNAIVSNLFSVGETRYRYPTDLLIVFFVILAWHILSGLRDRCRESFAGRKPSSEIQ